ncbi:hypothetical protein [Desulfobacula toluolica]|uniref:Uncharacterized protein n=1 Tax=Desulfobacula toluolica (strain DSM 7467 / Tol2) TaxID=651182 RepID=K0NKS9_DESTT|nr:hypothetical protein [Desulfobacula toluolica]CCK82171.1 uncharacterized protein TOL2_C40160 [Desulfobacula toluolica Tol2]
MPESIVDENITELANRFNNCEYEVIPKFLERLQKPEAPLIELGIDIETFARTIALHWPSATNSAATAADEIPPDVFYDYGVAMEIEEYYLNYRHAHFKAHLLAAEITKAKTPDESLKRIKVAENFIKLLETQTTPIVLPSIEAIQHHIWDRSRATSKKGSIRCALYMTDKNCQNSGQAGSLEIGLFKGSGRIYPSLQISHRVRTPDFQLAEKMAAVAAGLPGYLDAVWTLRFDKEETIDSSIPLQGPSLGLPLAIVLKGLLSNQFPCEKIEQSFATGAVVDADGTLAPVGAVNAKIKSLLQEVKVDYLLTAAGQDDALLKQLKVRLFSAETLDELFDKLSDRVKALSTLSGGNRFAWMRDLNSPFFQKQHIPVSSFIPLDIIDDGEQIQAGNVSGRYAYWMEQDHTCLCGTPASGKTTLLLYFMNQMSNRQGITPVYMDLANPLLYDVLAYDDSFTSHTLTQIVLTACNSSGLVAAETIEQLITHGRLLLIFDHLEKLSFARRKAILDYLEKNFSIRSLIVTDTFPVRLKISEWKAIEILPLDKEPNRINQWFQQRHLSPDQCKDAYRWFFECYKEIKYPITFTSSAEENYFQELKQKDPSDLDDIGKINREWFHEYGGQAQCILTPLFIDALAANFARYHPMPPAPNFPGVPSNTRSYPGAIELMCRYFELSYDNSERRDLQARAMASIAWHSITEQKYRFTREDIQRWAEKMVYPSDPMITKAMAKEYDISVQQVDSLLPQIIKEVLFKAGPIEEQLSIFFDTLPGGRFSFRIPITKIYLAQDHVRYSGRSLFPQVKKGQQREQLQSSEKIKTTGKQRSDISLFPPDVNIINSIYHIGTAVLAIQITLVALGYGVRLLLLEHTNTAPAEAIVAATVLIGLTSIFHLQTLIKKWETGNWGSFATEVYPAMGKFTMLGLITALSFLGSILCARLSIGMGIIFSAVCFMALYSNILRWTRLGQIPVPWINISFHTHFFILFITWMIVCAEHFFPTLTSWYSGDASFFRILFYEIKIILPVVFVLFLQCAQLASNSRIKS